MGFFIHDLHQQQFHHYHGPPITLYRGQALSVDDLRKLQRSRGSRLAFNSFLSTSKNRSVSLDFAQQSSKRDGIIGILFVMTLDLTLSSAIFADVTEHSYFKAENEVLFSMHTVFRIEEVVEFEVRLTLTREHGAEWIRLTDQIEENIRTGSGWVRLAQMLSKVGRVNEVEELVLVLLQHQPNEP